MPQTMYFGDIKVVRHESDRPGLKTSYRVWQPQIKSDPFTGHTETVDVFHGLFVHPKNLFKKLAELAI